MEDGTNSSPSPPPNQSWRRNNRSSPVQDDSLADQEDSASSFLLPNSTEDDLSSVARSTGSRTVISIHILAIVILISLFSWFYLEALAGGDIEWVKDHLSMLGANLVISVLCLTTALTMIVLTPMSTKFAICLFAGIGAILFALKKWDDGESFEQHGAYNFLVLLVIIVPLNGLIQSILLCQRKMSPSKFHRSMTLSVMGTTLITTLLLMYYHSIWGNGANGVQLMHGTLVGTPLCEWDGLNIPFVDLLPNYIQNFWTGQLSCPVVKGIEAEWSHEGILTINCSNKEFKESGQQPTFHVLPDTKPWLVNDKIMHTYNKKIVERIKKMNYTEPVLVNDEGVESIIANCEENVSKVLIRVVRNEAVLDRVKTVEKAHQKQEETPTIAKEEHAAPSRKPNVMVLFMDAVSRRQFYRKLANTAATPAALPIWKDFYEAGYITSRVEDNCEDWSAQYTGIATSQYFDHELQSPFCLPPYYALEGNPFSNFEGPYSIVSRCFHGTNVHNHALEYMNQFRAAYPDRPWFQMGSFIEGHEGTSEVLLTLDDDMSKFIKGMEEDGTLENTIIFMLADHGLHMGINFMFTPNGRIEHLNPYLSVILPPLLTKKYSSLSRGLMHNQQSLITGYEIHATLKMMASGVMPESGDQDAVDGGAWRRGTLFDEELGLSRTCEQAKIPEEFCRCRVA
ncbi:hypothetical protein BGZ65_001329 [Modicella reniformis]|uniref:DUF229-domain-containing protein n=1 Tax=Modicella reniformis TaxID=1440133 RepID=A0A9P6M0Z6_9FUNG|nr:hypothetical protein BGZ65_001329 [Modicella reniformis]